VTVQAVVGDDARWSDTEHLLALVGDSLAHLGWMFARVNFKGIPKKPPQHIRRPGDVSKVEGVTITRNVTEKTTITAGSLTFAELDAVIAEQTGTAKGIEEV
jgi:hypothetical protein